MRNWFLTAFLVAALGMTAGCGEQSPSAGVDGGSGSQTATDEHAGHNHAPGEGHGEAPATAKAPGAPGSGPWAKLDAAKYKNTETGLTYATIKEGKGAEITDGKTAEMHYTGWLAKGGDKFDSSRDRGQPFPFTLGAGQVIPGWDQGVKGMKVGEQRQLVIPAELGYGDSGSPPVIPPGATLVFDVELMGIK